MGRELGYNYLNTAFTGTSSAALSGCEAFQILECDQGTSSKLQDMEFKKDGDK